MVYVAAGGAAWVVAVACPRLVAVMLVMQSTVEAMLLQQSMLHVPHNHMTLCLKFPAVLETTSVTCYM